MDDNQEYTLSVIEETEVTVDAQDVQETHTGRKKRICPCCQKPTASKRFCFKCRKKIPVGYPMGKSDEEILTEIRRNEEAKAQFKKSTALGILELDTENCIFHIYNGYYPVTLLTSYSFYTSQPHSYKDLFNRVKVTENVFFSFTVMEQPRREYKIANNLECNYQRTAKTVSVEPPLALITIRQAFAGMIEAQTQYLERQIRIAKATGKI